MARKKSVSISAKPAHSSDPPGAGATSLVGDFMPADVSVADDGALVVSEAGLGVLGRSVYRAVYVLSFGCVFSTMLLGRLVPGRDIIAKGIGDGAQAAKQAVGGIHGRGEKVHAARREAGLQA